MSLPCNFLGKVEYCLLLLFVLAEVDCEIVRPFVEEVFEAEADGGCCDSAEAGGINIGSKATVTTTSLTRSPDFRIKETTVSWLACLTS